MKRLFSVGVFACCLVSLNGQPEEAEVLTRLVNHFLDGASRNDVAVHERFWAEDLIYTSSSGKRFGKAEILRDVRNSPPAKPGEPETAYSAGDLRVQLYGEAAVVAFRLVARSADNGTVQVSRYLNSGTFVKRNGEWRAVCWQATRMAPPE